MSLDRSMRRAFDEEAVADVVGTMLLVALTVSVAAGLGVVVMGAVPGPTPPTGFQLAVGLEPICPWGDGDDVVVLHHRGGEAISSGSVEVLLATIAGDTRLTLASFDEAGDMDGRLGIGERWTSPGVAITEGELVQVEVVQGSPGRVVHSATVRASGTSCGGSP